MCSALLAVCAPLLPFDSMSKYQPCSCVRFRSYHANRGRAQRVMYRGFRHLGGEGARGGGGLQGPGLGVSGIGEGHTNTDVLLSDTQSLNISRPHSDAQNKSAWKAKTVIACT